MDSDHFTFGMVCGYGRVIGRRVPPRAHPTGFRGELLAGLYLLSSGMYDTLGLVYFAIWKRGVTPVLGVSPSVRGGDADGRTFFTSFERLFSVVGCSDGPVADFPGHPPFFGFYASIIWRFAQP